MKKENLANQMMTNKRQNIKNKKIDQVIKAGFLVVIIMALVMELSSFASLFIMSKTSGNSLNIAVNEVTFIEELEQEMVDFHRVIYQSVASNNSSEAAALLKETYATLEETASTLEALAAESSDEIYASSITQILSDYKAITAATDEMYKKITAGDVSAAYAMVEAEMEPHFVSIEESCHNMKAVIEGDIAEKKMRMKAQVVSSVIFNGILLILMLLSSRKTAKTTIDLIAVPMKEIENAMNKLAAGDFSATVDYESENEIGVVAKKIKETIQTIQKYIKIENDILYRMSELDFDIEIEEDFIGDFKEMQDSIEKIIVAMNAMFQQALGSASVVNEASDQVAQVAQVIATSATEQAASVQELVATIHQITDDVTTNAQMAESMSENAHLVNEKIESGKACMDDLKLAMNEITAKSEAISNIIDMINDIADQTNLLSINASIEAAHVGDMGKGFGVVAIEIGKLAQQCAEAVKDTETLVKDSLAAVKVGSTKVDESLVIMEDIVTSNLESSGHLESLSDVCNQQAAALEQTLASSNMLAESVQENTGMAEEASASSEELKAQAQELHETFLQCKMREA